MNQWLGLDAPQHHKSERGEHDRLRPATNTYDLTFEVNWEGAPESGNLAVNEFSYLVVAIRWSRRSLRRWSRVGLNAYFEEETTCSATNGNAYYAPILRNMPS